MEVTCKTIELGIYDKLTAKQLEELQKRIKEGSLFVKFGGSLCIAPTNKDIESSIIGVVTHLDPEICKMDIMDTYHGRYIENYLCGGVERSCSSTTKSSEPIKQNHTYDIMDCLIHYDTITDICKMDIKSRVNGKIYKNIIPIDSVVQSIKDMRLMFNNSKLTLYIDVWDNKDYNVLIEPIPKLLEDRK